MQDVDKQIPTTVPHMGHANLDKCHTISPYMPQVGGMGLAIDRCIIIRLCHYIAIIIIIIMFSKTSTSKYTKKLGIFNLIGTIVDQKIVLKQAGVVHNIKSQYIN